MPFYEYKCMKCGCKVEEFQHIDDEPLRDCPKCAGLLKKLLSRTAAQTVKDAKEQVAGGWRTWQIISRDMVFIDTMKKKK